MFSYESGLLIAFLLWLWVVVSALISINSRMERNLNKIGLRLSWMTLTSKPISPEEAGHTWVRKCLKFLLLYGSGLPLVFTSWLYVLYVVGLIAYRKNKDFGAPQAIREFRWKLRNVDMTFDQIVKELMKLSEQDPAQFEQVRADMVAEMQERGLRVR